MTAGTTDNNSSGRHQSRATLLAGVIGAVGTIVGAIIGHHRGEEQSADTLVALERQLKDSGANAVAELRTALNRETKRIQVLEQQLSVARGASPEDVGAIGSARSGVQRDLDFDFELVSCEASGSVIGCDMRVKNLIGQRRLVIHSASTQLLSDRGDEYRPSRVRLGREVGAYDAGASIPGGATISARLEFGPVAPGTARFQTLQIGAQTWDQNGNSQFPTVTFSPVLAR
jgi:hypothetical protein